MSRKQAPHPGVNATIEQRLYDPEFFGYQLGRGQQPGTNGPSQLAFATYNDSLRNSLGFRHRIAIKIKVKCHDTLPGENLRVTGSCAEFGNWSPTNSPVLSTNADEFPIWKGLIQVDPNHLQRKSILEYKYVVCLEGSGQPKRWEPIAGNRIIDLLNNKEVTIEDVFGDPHHLREELTLYKSRKSQELISEEVSADFGSSDLFCESPAYGQKVVKKVRELKNVAEQYNQIKQQKKQMSSSKQSQQLAAVSGGQTGAPQMSYSKQSEGIGPDFESNRHLYLKQESLTP